jgi:glutamate synthase (NADPH/NADH) large chain
MTGGTAVILGPVGDNFAAGMTGGMAFVLDADGRFERRINPESVIWQRIETPFYDALLRGLVERHVEETQSAWADGILREWDRMRGQFWQVVPKEMLARLEHPVRLEAAE